MDVSIQVKGFAGLITLTRSQALNSLTHDMCLLVEHALDMWASNPQIRLVLIDAEGGKAFCAGGDIVKLYENNARFAQQFWRDEYRLNYKLATYCKPIVSFLHGIVMGGGVGLGAHVSHRIAGSDLNLSLPECGIGLIPDVGTTRLLRRAPSGIGKFVGTTGYRMGVDDALLAGFVDVYVPNESWPSLKNQLALEGDVSVIATHRQETEPGFLRRSLQEIASCFAQGTMQDAIHLMGQAGDWGRKALKQIAASSPLSLLVMERILLSLNHNPRIEDALRQEYRFTFRAKDEADFIEGVRAKLIDRDNAPQWKYPSIDHVPQCEISAVLGHLGDKELQFSGGKI